MVVPDWEVPRYHYLPSPICSHTQKKKQVLKKKKHLKPKHRFMILDFRCLLTTKKQPNSCTRSTKLSSSQSSPHKPKKKHQLFFLWSTLYTSPLFTPSTCFLHRHNIPSIPTWCVDSRGLVVSEMQDPLGVSCHLLSRYEYIRLLFESCWLSLSQLLLVFHMKERVLKSLNIPTKHIKFVLSLDSRKGATKQNVTQAVDFNFFKVTKE